MMKFTSTTLLAAFLLLGAHLSAQQINIVPKPTKLTVSDNSRFAISATTPLVVLHGNEELVRTARIYSSGVEQMFGGKMEVKSGRAATGAVMLSVAKALGQEEYRLIVGRDKIEISGGSARAVQYGLQTLTQVITSVGVSGGSAAIPTMEVEDKPFFAYRGGMLDVGRYFYSVDDVKTFIDILALHKLNTFHFHLTEDQGWRIEIKKYPELTKVGSKRSESHVGHYKEQRWDTQPYGGFYTQEQIKDIVKYATDRHIEVIPEIELPGHATAALASYPQLGCRSEGYKVEKVWGVHKEVFCAGRETTFEFLQGVLEEVIELFPSKNIHIGGDECPKVRWKECVDCQRRIKENDLRDETHLQSYFVQRIEKWLSGHGKSIVGWDEIMDGGLSKTATVMSWRGSKGGIEAARMGNRVIMSPNVHCYLNYYQGPKESEPLTISGDIPVSKAYALDPYDKLEESQYKYIWGVQANMWTEYASNMTYVQYMLLPRIAAIAEVGWAYPRKDYDDFVKRMDVMRRLYDYYGYSYATHIFDAK